MLFLSRGIAITLKSTFDRSRAAMLYAGNICVDVDEEKIKKFEIRRAVSTANNIVNNDPKSEKNEAAIKIDLKATLF